jgi:hypothetical protein
MFNRSRVDRASRSSPRHHHHVIGLKLIEQPAQLRTVGFGSADMHVAENLSASGLGQLPDLSVNALAARRYPCVTIFHGLIMQPIYAAKKPNLFNYRFFCCEIL